MHDARHASAVEGHSGFCRNLSARLASPTYLGRGGGGSGCKRLSSEMLLVNQVHLGDGHIESTEGTKEGRKEPCLHQA